MKLYVGNLPFSFTDKDLRELFAPYGEVSEVVIISDKFSGKSKGFGFVTFANDEAGQKAVSELNEKDVQGRAIKVNEARPLEERPPRRNFERRSRY